MINNVCVLTIKVKEMDEAIDFYTGVLDFEVSNRYGDKIVSLVHNEMAIVLEEGEAVEVGQNVLPGLLSKNLDEDLARLKSRGAKVLFDEPRPCPPGRFSVIVDPSGNQLELVEFSKSSLPGN